MQLLTSIIVVFTMNQYSFQLPCSTDATLENRRRTRICGKSELTLTLNHLCDDLNIKNNTLSTERMDKLYPLLDKECCLRNNCGELFISVFCPYLRGDDTTTEEPRFTTENPVKAKIIINHSEFPWINFKKLW